MQVEVSSSKSQSRMRREKALQDGRAGFLERRQSILTAAAQVFAEVGYTPASVSAIAERANLNPASIYYYFANKGELLAELLQDALQKLYDELAEIRDSDASASTKLKRAMRRLMESYAENYPHQYWYQVAQNRYSTLRDLADDEVLLSLAVGCVDDFICIIQQGLDTGEFVEVDNPELMARGLLGMVNATAGWYRPDSGLEPARIGEAFADMVLGGITKIQSTD